MMIEIQPLNTSRYDWPVKRRRNSKRQKPDEAQAVVPHNLAKETPMEKNNAADNSIV